MCRLATKRAFMQHASCSDWYGLPLHQDISKANNHQFEAGMFPGVILQMTYWYRPDEMSIRLLYFCKWRNPL